MGKEKKNNNSNSSTVFKVGAIALAFMIIGYQTAIFVHRAAVLRIEACRDVPDTVYVLQLPSDEDGRGAEVAPKSPALPRREFRKMAEHTEMVENVRKNTRHIESFSFNPNTVSVDDLVRLGFSQKQAESIENYRSKGGQFRRKTDFAKSFVVSDSIYSRLEKYIDIPLVDINAADSSALVALPGIGPYFASKIVEYRNRLGGYSFPEQLMDIYHLDRDKFEAISDLVTIGTPARAFAIWSLPADSLKTHPYIRNWQTARAIVLYRDNSPRESWSVESLFKAGIINEETASKLSRCRIECP